MAFDSFHFEDRKFVAHLNNLALEVCARRTALDDSTESTNLGLIEAERPEVVDSVTRVLINYEEVHISPETSSEHSLLVVDALEGFRAFMTEMLA